MKTNSIITQFLPSFNRQFIKRLLYRWVMIFILLNLSSWFFSIQINVQTLSSTSWNHVDPFPDVISIVGLPAMFIASLVVALLQTKTDRQQNYPRVYWIAYFIPTIILFSATYFSYRYYTTYTTQRDQNFRQELEQGIKENNHPNYAVLADMYENGWGGPQDINKAFELYQKACDNAAVNSSDIEACKKTKNYQKLRVLLKDSHNPYDMVTLATLYETGLGGPSDPEKTKELYQKACPDKNDFICTKYKPFQ